MYIVCGTEEVAQGQREGQAGAGHTTFCSSNILDVLVEPHAAIPRELTGKRQERASAVTGFRVYIWRPA